MFRKRVFWIGLLIVLALAGGGYAYYRAVYLPGQEPEEVLMTAEVTRGDLIISVSGSGMLCPLVERELGFETKSGDEVAGTVAEILVEVGDQVHEADVLARLDTDDLERAVVQAGFDLRQAQLDLADATEAATDAERADARTALESARAALTLAQVNYENAQISDRVADVRARQIAFDYAVDRYWQAEESGADQGGLEKAWSDWASAEYAFNQAIKSAELEKLEAWNGVDQARNDVSQARERLASLERGPDERTVLQTELRVDRAELALEEARDQLEAAELRAPFDGTVVDVAVVGGERVGNKAIITLANLEEPLVQFWVAESDMGGVAVGNRVEIEFEALPDHIFDGEVIRIDPALVTVQNALAVQAWASLDLSMQQVTLLGDMNADVEVISAEARDVVLAPVQALRTIGDGQYVVFVVQPDGELAMRPVDVGLKDAANAEIISGLEVGQGTSSMPVVSLGQRSASSAASEGEDQQMPGVPGGMVPGGGMFGGGGPGGGGAGGRP
ncbi:MAG: efflux RND transporter periplasmic adaptor subunit [Anaerolineae bacterium]